jgi:hypothetical protein
MEVLNIGLFETEQISKIQEAKPALINLKIILLPSSQ